jgi:hypothetical protein
MWAGRCNCDDRQTHQQVYTHQPANPPQHRRTFSPLLRLNRAAQFRQLQQMEEQSNRISLYKVLGGGWKE